MFKITTEPTFTHEVKARVPVDGGFEEERFKATFRVIAPEALADFDLGTNEGTTAFLRAIVARLDDIGDAEGKPIEFSDKVLDSALKLPWARAALAKTYFEAMAGAKKGN